MATELPATFEAARLEVVARRGILERARERQLRARSEYQDAQRAVDVAAVESRVAEGQLLQLVRGESLEGQI